MAIEPGCGRTAKGNAVDVKPGSRWSAEQFVLGCAQLGGLYRPLDDGTAQQTLEAAWEAGIRHFDTAPHYGAGLSERRVGAFLRQLPRGSYTLSTKVGRLLVDTDEDTEGVDGFYGADPKRRVLDYSGPGVRRSIEESLDRLGLDRIDTIFIHDPDDHMDQAIGQAYPELHRMRAEGLLAHIGAGMNAVAPLIRLVRETEADTIMLAGRYTLLDREAEPDLLPLCAERRVSVVVAGVYNSGLLAAPQPGATYNYAEAPPELVAQALRLQEICAAHGVPLRAAAMQFALAPPAVTAVAVGCRTAEQVRDNLDMLTHPVPAQLWDDLLTVSQAG
jgi:D-threo-aldose 1-dehydrogenase